MKGNELSANQINQEFDRLGAALRESEIGTNLIKIVDSSFAAIRRPTTFRETVKTFCQMVRMKRRVKRNTKRMLAESHLPRAAARKLYRAASSRASLIQRSVILLQVEKLFYYWHAIHLPFTIMMFITLGVHISVALWLGYRWIF